MATEVTNPLAITQKELIALEKNRNEFLSRWVSSRFRTQYKGVRQTAAKDRGLYKHAFPFLKSHQVVFT